MGQLPTIEIMREDWAVFFERFDRLHRDTLVTIQLAASNGNRDFARDWPLLRVSYNAEGCNDVLSWILDHPDRREIAHTIVQPIHVKFRQMDDGRKSLEIRAENGTTLVNFSSGKMDQVLDGLRVNSRRASSEP